MFNRGSRRQLACLTVAGVLFALAACSADPSEVDSPEASDSASASGGQSADPTSDLTEDPPDGEGGDPASDEEDPQDPPETVAPPAVLADVPEGAVVVAAGSEIDCTGRDVVVTEGLQQVTLVGDCRSVTVNASSVDLMGVSTGDLAIAGDLCVIRFEKVTGTVKIIGSENLVTAPEAVETIDDGKENAIY
jgi:hypothetical protein